MAMHTRVSLHETTVRQAHTLSPYLARPQRRRSSRHPAPVDHSRVHPEVWALVRALMNSPRGYTKFEVISLTEVVVR